MKLEILPIKHVIQSDRLILKKHSLEDVYQMFTSLDENRNYLGLFLPWIKKIQSVENLATYIRWSDNAWKENEAYNFGIFSKSKREYLGNIGCNRVNIEDLNCEIGYWLKKDAQGKGFAIEAAETLCKELFNCYFHRIEVYCVKSNEKAQSIPRRLNFREEALLRDKLFINGRFEDMILYSKLNEDEEF